MLKEAKIFVILSYFSVMVQFIILPVAGNNLIGKQLQNVMVYCYTYIFLSKY